MNHRSLERRRNRCPLVTTMGAYAGENNER